jgi:hypothetical protein
VSRLIDARNGTPSEYNAAARQFQLRPAPRVWVKAAPVTRTAEELKNPT